MIDTRPIYDLKVSCKHADAGPKTLMCPDCNGVMRRCCQSILSFQHENDCGERARLIAKREQQKAEEGERWPV